MDLALKLGLDGLSLRGGSAGTNAAITALGARNGFAIDFVNDRMVINDALTPANAYDGSPVSKLTQYGVDAYEIDDVKGLNLSASRDFGIALATSLFPFNPGAIHVYARFELNAADHSDQRYLFMVDNAGNDRFAIYTTTGGPFRWVTADGNSADTEISGLSLTGQVEMRMTVGADTYGRTWVDDGGVQTNDNLHQIAAATPTHVGIGGYPDQAFRLLDGYLAEIAVICEDIPIEKRLSLSPYPALFAAEGDSHTFNVSIGLSPADFYPAQIGVSRGMVVRNVGASGDSSSHMLADVSNFLAGGAPDIGCIYAGSNDMDTTISPTPAPTDTVFSVVDISKHTVGGHVLVNGESRVISSISGSEITLTTPLTEAPLVGAVVEVDTTANIRAWIQAVSAAGVPDIYVVGAHYLNFASGGDTTEGEQSLRAALRSKQLAAATAESVTYVDTYAFMRQRILDGFVAQGDWAVWHQGAADTHLTAAGEQEIANAILAEL